MKHRAVVVDRWDVQDLDAASGVSVFAEARKKLALKVPWGGVALDDVFFLLFLAQPRVVDVDDIDPRHLVQHVLVSLLAEQDAVRRLRRSTMRDPMVSAQVAAKLAPQFAESIRDVMPERAMLETFLLSVDALDETGPDGYIEKQVAFLRDAVLVQAQDGTHTAAVRLADASEHLADQTEQATAVAAIWGATWGHLQHLPLPERLRLAELLDTPRMRQIAELFGRLRTSMHRDLAAAPDAGVEPTGLELGADLGRMAGSELLYLAGAEDLFLARLAGGEMAQYAVTGDAPAARGGIVLCVDGSSSMGLPCQGYSREAWAQALRLFLLRVAEREHRPMHVINFGAPGEFTVTRFVSREDFAPQRILEAATEWFGGGTDFVTPLREAVRVLEETPGERADVVVVSDGECSLPVKARDRYREATGRLGARTWGLQVGGAWSGLGAFSDEVFTVTDLLSGREIGDLLGRVTS